MKVILVAILLVSIHFSVQSQAHPFPYDLSKKDYVLLPLATLALFGGEYMSDHTDFYLSIDEISSLDRMKINPFDRPATLYWNRSLNDVSDIFPIAMPIISGTVVLPQLYQKQWRNTLIFGVMYLEAYFLTKGITEFSKSLAQRTRPYLYNTQFTPAERYDFQGVEAPEANSSFFSGHTSSAFAAAVFLSKTYSDIYGNSTWSALIWTGSLSIATFTAYCRVASGEHFTSDVLAGALVGGAIGYFIPVLHKSKSERFSFTILPGSVSLSYRL
ncbi:MAG: phosphatase PAP2 family protein [Bacteroidales bacterium]|nr:phosphatase PAP2 family protein [Bacteroidales bacterium]